MLAVLAKLGISGGAGFLIGLGIVAWVQPTTHGGTGLLTMISVTVCVTIGGIGSKLFEKSKKGGGAEPPVKPAA
jgi:hypothetical protein